MPTTIDDSAVLALTPSGERELREAGTELEPRHLQVLVLIDGNATVARVRRRAKDMPAQLFGECLAELVDKGLVSAHGEPPLHALDPSDFFSSGAALAAAAAERGENVDAEAAATTEFLRHNGYCVNVARRAKAGHKPPAGRKPAVLVIDDDPDICRLLRVYLKMEGFEPRTAGNRNEILAELRRSPLPDLVLLDVGLPDASGFDILHKMREHPVLKALPVIMLTGEATREAVLKGILGGADGYVTKPFDIHHMVRAVQVVLGLATDPNAPDWDYSL